MAYLYICLAARFRMIPTFGKGTIRKFSNNVSEMKKLAARDFEDILQVRNSSRLQFVAIPNEALVLYTRI
jgi:hypothetical protein